jgi:hypothetical protein
MSPLLFHPQLTELEKIQLAQATSSSFGSQQFARIALTRRTHMLTQCMSNMFYLFEGTSHEVADRSDIALLANSMNSTESLFLDHRIPVRF